MAALRASVDRTPAIKQGAVTKPSTSIVLACGVNTTEGTPDASANVGCTIRLNCNRDRVLHYGAISLRKRNGSVRAIKKADAMEHL